ncbi:hypothetical protein F5J12DRAFT_787757 [Pisolithus orientalis]|uniref:uncharacterized protein n=1 Tax=Pisolithus orientalis TaxID=936130 RepID=UPI00222449A9|nr:uncharacterized protein F5J12DRAFT_787757 [Pisolithus orientalis]KAI5983693.1 hypothetical protein F5J12DRAFT_787757 [Pisolithus orientalis]
MAPPSNKTFLSLPSSSKLSGEDILDGRQEVPEHMTHTFQRVIIQKAWVEVQWYYSRSDIGDKNMRKYIGNNELVLSDHNDIIEPEAIVSWKLMESIAPADITSFSAERAPSMLALSVKNHIAQTKLNNETRKGKHQTPGHHKGSPKWDRGNEGGVVGNGEVMMSMWEEVRAAQNGQRQEVETGLQNHMTSDLIQQAQKSYVYY